VPGERTLAHASLGYLQTVSEVFIRVVENSWFDWIFGICAVVFILVGLMLAGWFCVRQIWREARARRFGVALATTVALCSCVFLLWAGSQIAP
jgi:hypothetical protein